MIPESHKKEETYALFGATRALKSILEHSAAYIELDELRVLANLPDTDYYEAIDDRSGYVQGWEPATIDNSEIRQLASQELEHRGAGG